MQPTEGPSAIKGRGERSFSLCLTGNLGQQSPPASMLGLCQEFTASSLLLLSL